MKFEQVRNRVERAERLLEGRRLQVVQHTDALLEYWKQGWTPWRIVAAGLGLGFVVGQTRPTRAIGATKWLRTASTLSGMFTTLQTALAAWQADKAAAGASHPAAANDAADDITQQARHAATTRAAGMATADTGDTPAHRGSSYRRASDERVETESWAAQPPRPAAAATDVSERQPRA